MIIRRGMARGPVVLAMACSLVLAACGSDDDQSTETADAAAAEAQEGTDPTATAEPNRGTTVEPGTYTYAGGGAFPAAFSYTFTTEVATLDSSNGGGLYGRQVLGDPYGALEFDFPVAVADLSQLVTDDSSATEGRADQNLLYAGPIGFPSDVGAWLDESAALDVVDDGTLSLGDGQARWWDVEVSEQAAACFPDSTADDPPCVLLWPSGDGQDDPQIGLGVEGPTRVYAIEAGTQPLMAIAHLRGGPEAESADWLATTDEIVSSITVG